MGDPANGFHETADSQAAREPPGPGVAARRRDERHQEESSEVRMGRGAGQVGGRWLAGEERRKPAPVHKHGPPLDSDSSPLTPES